MKRFLNAVLLATIILLVSCTKESYRHAVGIVYPSDGIYYIDQINDSVVFQTFDSYEVTSQSEWLRPNYEFESPKSRINNLYYSGYVVKVGIDMEPNNTKKCRYGFVNVRSYGDDGWDQTAVAVYYQLAWHNIIKPSPMYILNGRTPVTANFVLHENANCMADTIAFNSYQDWKLIVPENSFVHPVTTKGRAGNQIIKIVFDENMSTKPDSVMLTLSTAGYEGIETSIWIHRKGLPEKE